MAIFRTSIPSHANYRNCWFFGGRAIVERLNQQYGRTNGSRRKNKITKAFSRTTEVGHRVVKVHRHVADCYQAIISGLKGDTRLAKMGEAVLLVTPHNTNRNNTAAPGKAIVTRLFLLQNKKRALHGNKLLAGIHAGLLFNKQQQQNALLSIFRDRLTLTH